MRQFLFDTIAKFALACGVAAGVWAETLQTDAESRGAPARGVVK